MFILTRDDDGHWFVIPEDKKEEWNKFLDEVIEADVGNELPMDIPYWAHRINGPSHISFSSFIEH